MIFYNIKDIEGFMNAVNDCEGKVELLTDQGDVLNLKSSLCKYVALAKLVGAQSEIKDIKVNVENPNDVWKIINYLSTEK
ncbi:MAG: polya polymerase [Clostridiales bacterium]|nr:polya polymerase [Clostridiales bacterium]